ncbi:MAG: tripartite tricarboxylate transporter TctB family protein [Methylocystaceae bacterium]|nr:tripartite tricarboxylate transporter TctB family protein [Methylocystaceae bacterium]
MTNKNKHRMLRPETLTALGIILISGAFLAPAFELGTIAALLPAVMLIGLIALSLILLIGDQRAASAGSPPEQVTKSPKRVIGSFILIVCYVLSVDYIGFYPSTAIGIPLIAYIFGFRNLLGLVAASVIVVGAVYLIFDLGMHRDFPIGHIWMN